MINLFILFAISEKLWSTWMIVIQLVTFSYCEKQKKFSQIVGHRSPIHQSNFPTAKRSVIYIYCILVHLQPLRSPRGKEFGEIVRGRTLYHSKVSQLLPKISQSTQPCAISITVWS